MPGQFAVDRPATLDAVAAADVVANPRTSIWSTSSDRRVGDSRNFKQNTACRTKHLCIQMLFQQGKSAPPWRTKYEEAGNQDDGELRAARDPCGGRDRLCSDAVRSRCPQCLYGWRARHGQRLLGERSGG